MTSRGPARRGKGPVPAGRGVARPAELPDREYPGMEQPRSRRRPDRGRSPAGSRADRSARALSRLTWCAVPRLAALLLAAALSAPLPAPPAAAGDEGPPRMDDGRPHRAEGWEELDCAACHRAQAEEWSESLHALAWVDPHYREELGRMRRPEGCHGCHAPEPLHLGDLGAKPAPRDGAGEPRALGISCRSCHQGPDGTILGPFGAPTDAHPSVQSPSFMKEGRDALCAACHRTTVGPVLGVARDFEASGLAARGRSCVSCHMPAEPRPAAVPQDGPPGPERVTRSHRVLGPWDREFLAEAFELSARAEVGPDGPRTVLVVENGAGHRVPGLLTRSFAVEARLLDGEGATLAEGALEIDARNHLPVDAPLELALPGRGARVAVRVLHRAPGVAEPIEVLARSLAPEEE